jgi:hypothetical protein
MLVGLVLMKTEPAHIDDVVRALKCIRSQAITTLSSR